MKKFVCIVCGYIHEGERAPEVCPVCKVGADKFDEMKGDLKWADEHRIGVAQGEATKPKVKPNRNAPENPFKMGARELNPGKLKLRRPSKCKPITIEINPVK